MWGKGEARDDLAIPPLPQGNGEDEMDGTEAVLVALRAEIEALKARVPDLGTASRALLAQAERIGLLEQSVAWLGQQRTAAQAQLDLQARGLALDLAIKAAGPSGDAAATVPIAEAFLGWLRGGG